VAAVAGEVLRLAQLSAALLEARMAKKGRCLQIELPPAVLAALREVASRNLVTMADVIRKLVLREIREHGIKLDLSTPKPEQQQVIAP
jgi:hypothetical protein